MGRPPRSVEACWWMSESSPLRSATRRLARLHNLQPGTNGEETALPPRPAVRAAQVLSVTCGWTKKRAEMTLAWMGVPILAAAAAFALPDRADLLARSLSEEAVDNLRAFAELHTYVRWLHPSDGAAAVPWDVSAVHGARRVRALPSGAALRPIDALLERALELIREAAPEAIGASDESELWPSPTDRARQLKAVRVDPRRRPARASPHAPQLPGNRQAL